MRRLTLLLALLAACGPKPTGDTTPGGGTGPGGDGIEPGGDAGRTKGKKVTYDFEAAPLNGAVFVPQGLDKPLMPGGEKVVKRSLGDQRRRYQKAKGAARATEGEAFAVLLWFKPDSDGDVSVEQRVEATAVLRDIAPVGKASEELVHKLAVAEQTSGNKDAALAAWQDLATRFADSKQHSVYVAMVAYHDLRGSGLTKFAEGEDAPPEALYVNAWQYFTMGRLKEASGTLVLAVGTWNNPETLPALRRDVMLLLARSGEPMPRMFPFLEGLAKRDGANLDTVEGAAVQAYAFAGEYKFAIDALEILATRSAKDALAEVRYAEADLYFRMWEPEKAAELVLAAWAAAESADTKELVAKLIGTFATVFHGVFANSSDGRYAAAATQLYAAYAAVPGRPDADKLKTQAADLESHLASGGGSPQLTNQVVHRRVLSAAEQIIACYEQQLQGQPDLTGSVALHFVVDAEGATSAVSATSKGGDRLKGAATCIAERAKTWRFPKQKEGHIVEANVPFAFSPLPTAAPAGTPQN